MEGLTTEQKESLLIDYLEAYRFDDNDTPLAHEVLVYSEFANMFFVKPDGARNGWMPSEDEEELNELGVQVSEWLEDQLNTVATIFEKHMDAAREELKKKVL
jgi:hypothetical protein